MNSMEKIKKYDTIVIGLGASGLFFCAGSGSAPLRGKTLVLEKNNRAGVKLLMSGGGQCNFTHQGSIKEFTCHYGDKGSAIRHCLYKHNNLEMMDFVQALGISILKREDGKVFPKSLQSKELLDALLKKCHENQVSILYDRSVMNIVPLEKGFSVTASDSSGDESTFCCDNLVVASGGCSYPTTGSDGRIFNLLSKGLNIPLVTPRPALTPIYISDYPFSSVSGVSLSGVAMKIIGGNSCDDNSSGQNTDKSRSKSASRVFTGDLLFTHKNLSGPLILNNSRYVSPQDALEFNYVYPEDYQRVVAGLKSAFHGNGKEVIPFISGKYMLPRSFVQCLLDDDFLHKKMSSLSGSDINLLALRLTKSRYTVQSLSGFNKAMVTAGGVHLSAVNLKTMESTQYPGLFFIGEVLDIDGDTGGYNIQFAYSSAMVVRDRLA